MECRPVESIAFQAMDSLQWISMQWFFYAIDWWGTTSNQLGMLIRLWQTRHIYFTAYKRLSSTSSARLDFPCKRRLPIQQTLETQWRVQKVFNTQKAAATRQLLSNCIGCNSPAIGAITSAVIASEADCNRNNCVVCNCIGCKPGPASDW